MKKTTSLDRRTFLKTAGIAAAAVAVPTVLHAKVTNATKKVPAPPKAPEKPTPKELPRVKLGGTDLMLTVMSLGTGPGQDVNVMKFALKKGINFFHTSTSYAGGRAIRNVADTIKGMANPPHIGLKITWRPDDMDAFDKALETLGVDQVPIAFFNVHNAKKLEDPVYKKAAEQLKNAGKCRYIGLTSHSDTKNCMEIALKHGFYDALMPSYNISMAEEFAPVFEQAAKQKVGVVLMKTEKSLGGESYRKAIGMYQDTPAVTTINRGMTSLAQINTNVNAILNPSSKQEREEVARIARIAAIGSCEMCGACTAACPQNIAVADFVRCSDYYMQDAQIEVAKETCAAIPRNQRPDTCTQCGACEKACPRNVPVRHHLARAKTLYA